jgi:peroxiredoxin Q/BCP
MAMLDVGDKAPAFSLEDQSGKTVKLSDFKGKKVVLYFYPKDDTPGCTREACAFRDEHSALRRPGGGARGEPGLRASHAKFAGKYELPFPCSPTRTTRCPRSTVRGARSRSTGASSWASPAPRS